MRRGALVILFTFVLGTAANTVAVQFWSDSHDRFAVANVKAQGFRATLLAQAGLQSAILAVERIPEQFLFQSGMAIAPPDILVEDCKPKCFITYRIYPENGRINLNNLVRVDDKASVEYRNIVQRLFAAYQIQPDTVDSIIDWIDENESIEGAGAESYYYERLSPPVKIKNFRLFNLSEISRIKGLNYNVLYESRAPEGWLAEQKELKFLNEDERSLITADDWIPVNNLTAFYDHDSRGTDKININAARYHVLMSLSDSMTREAALAIFRLRRKNRDYIKKIDMLKDLPEFNVQTPSGVTLYEELAGTGGTLSGLITTEGEIYRIVGVGSILPASDNPNSAVARKITALYKKSTKKIIFYAEE